MQWRDIVSGVVFDVFYEEGYECKAEDFQKSMKDLLGDEKLISVQVSLYSSKMIGAQQRS
jgi:hypothetical protein